MSRPEPPLPLESFRRPDEGQPRAYRISAVAAVAQVGLCLSVLTVPIYAALIWIPPAVPRLHLYEKFAAGFGFAAMATLAALCIAMLKCLAWSRGAMIAWGIAVLTWQIANLLIVVLFYAPARRELLVTALAEQMAAATQPASRPAYFDAFSNVGIWVMPVLTFVAIGGFAWWSVRVMRSTEARTMLG